MYTTLIFVIINLLILLNVVIAMMTDTYSLMSSVRKGLYNYNIVKATYSYKLDSQYGGLILLPPPLCIISFLTIPIYWRIKDS